MLFSIISVILYGSGTDRNFEVTGRLIESGVTAVSISGLHWQTLSAI